MATIRKRGAKWQVQIRRVGFPPISRSFHVHKDAEAWARQKRDENVARLKASGPGVPENVKLVSLWYSATLLECWCVVEAEDATSLGEIQKHWTDLNFNHITPVLTEDEVLQIFS